MTIRKMGHRYTLYSKTGHKKLGSFGSRSAALHREKQIQYFKNDKKYFKDHGRHIPIKRKR